MSGILASSTAVQGQGVSLSGQKIPAMNAAVPSSPAEGVAVPSGGGGDGFCNIKDRGPAGLSPICTRLRQKRSSCRYRGDNSAGRRVERGGSRSSRGEKTRGEKTHRGGGDFDADPDFRSPETGAMPLTTPDPERTLANSGFHGWADSARSIVLRLTPADLKSALRTFSVPVFGNVAMNST